MSRILTVVFFLALLGVSAFMIFRPSARLAWIDLPAVYNGFEYKKEMESRLVRIQEARKHILDSMELDLRIISEELRASSQKDPKKMVLYQQMGEDYINRKKLFEEDNYMNKAKYEEQILKQLNQYVRDFAEKHGYSFIYGADGTGNLMYGDRSLDITEEVKKYVNDKYKGGN